MKDLFYLLVFSLACFWSLSRIFYAALMLGLPYTWFPANRYPLCPECRQRALKLCGDAGMGLIGIHSLQFHQCQFCGARWMRDCSGSAPWKEASDRKWNHHFLPETVPPTIVSSEIWPPPPTISGQERQV